MKLIKIAKGWAFDFPRFNNEPGYEEAIAEAELVERQSKAFRWLVHHPGFFSNAWWWIEEHNTPVTEEDLTKILEAVEAAMIREVQDEI